MNPVFEIQLVTVIVAVSCSLPGVFLVLRKMSMASDSITHTILLGIVIAFLATNDMSSPLLIIGAAIIGVLTVWLTELLVKTRLAAEDAATGVIFPLLFSVAVILISREASNTHIDTDSVLLGELAFAPFQRMVVRGCDIGARAIYTSGALLVINLAFITVFFKELKLAAFDPLLAAVLGFSPAVMHYALMTLVSVTSVGAFEAAGSILVVALMVGPAVTARLVSEDLKAMLMLSSCFAMLSAVFGYRLAMWLDVSIAGSIAAAIGIIFAIVLCLSPKKGLVSAAYNRARKRREFLKIAFMARLCISPEVCGSQMRCRLMCELLREKKITLCNSYLIVTQRGKSSIEVFLSGIR